MQSIGTTARPLSSHRRCTHQQSCKGRVAVSASAAVAAPVLQDVQQTLQVPPQQQQQDQEQQQHVWKQTPNVQEDMHHLHATFHEVQQPQTADSCSSMPMHRGRRRRRRVPKSLVSLRQLRSSTGQGWSQLHAQLLEMLKQRDLIPKNSQVLVAVSGGQDSTAMLRLLVDLSQQQHWPLQLHVAHCDHRMRPDSAANAAHVRQYSTSMKLPYWEVVAPTPQHCRSEAAARHWRHQELLRLAQEAGCSFIALGHTATERAETLLFNLIRGSGARGLGSMTWKRPLPGGLQLVRPLLDFSREDTLKACELTRTQFYPDSTNEDERYARNRLRRRVFPHLTGINPRAVWHMAHAAEVLRQEEELLNDLVLREAEDVLVPCCLVGGHPAANGLQPDVPKQQPQAASSTSSSSAAAATAAAAAAMTSTFPRYDAHSSALQQGRELQLEQQQQQPQQAQQEELQVTALVLDALSAKHQAVKHRLVRAWLSSQSSRSISYHMVQEVLQLLRPGKGTGDRTSTLWSCNCVLRFKELLLVLKADAVQKVLSGQLAVCRVAVSADAMKGSTALRRSPPSGHLPLFRELLHAAGDGFME